MAELSLTLQAEILVPYALMQDRHPVEVERMLHDAGLLPATAQQKRWQMAAERSGYVLTFAVPLALAAVRPAQSQRPLTLADLERAGRIVIRD